MTHIFTNIGPRATTTFYGKKVPWGGLREARHYEKVAVSSTGLQTKITKLQRLNLPKASDEIGFKSVAAHPGRAGETTADAMVLDAHGQAVAMATRDCLSIVIYSPDGRIGVAHGSRATLKQGAGRHNVIANLLYEMGAKDIAEHPWKAHVFGGISAVCFEHPASDADIIDYQSWHNDTRLFVKLSDNKVGLDLRRAVLLQLLLYGFTKNHIETDTRCTFSDTRLGSRRREPDGGDHNLTLVVKH